MKSQPASERYSHFYQTLYDSVEEMNEMPEYDRQLCFEYFETVILPKSTLIETAEILLGINISSYPAI